jgi:retron-type reverse transcriptase
MVIESLGLPMFENVEMLAEEVRLTKKLVYFLSADDLEGRYRTYYILKKDGTLREINAPCMALKVVQRWVLQEILYKVRISQYSIGFTKNGKGSPLVQCAERHKNNLFILKMDLKDFFPSIKREKIFYQFLKLGYNTYASNLLTNICTVNGKLPQGGVTSAYLANLVCYKMDMRIAGYCNKRDITYTRYADDLVFSSDNRDSLWNIYGMIKKIVESEGFTINEKKTHFQTPKGHKEVIGVTVNDGMVKASKKMKRKVRAMIHNSIVMGDYSNNDIIRGYISYINSLEKNYRRKIIKYIEKYSSTDITLYPELVSKFNENKLYKEISDMKQNYIYRFCKNGEEDDYYEMLEREREKFEGKHNKYIEIQNR